MLTKELAVNQGFKSRRCPKCGGNIFIDRDIYSWYEQCLQCGRTFDLPKISDSIKQQDREVFALARIKGN